MTTRLDHRTRTALRGLDAADAPSDAGRTPAGAALLDRILATESAPDSAASHASTPTPRRSRLRWAAVAIPAAGALAFGAIVLPGPGGDDAAMATWRNVPTVASPHDTALLERACRKELGDHLRDEDFRRGYEIDPAQVRLALSERRGEWMFALLTGPHGLSATCATHLPAGSEKTRGRVLHGVTAGEPAAHPGPRGFTQGGIHQQGEPPASFTSGEVGSQVSSLTIHAGGHDVVATIRDGEYAAWWPGRAFAEGDPGPSGQGGPRPMLRYTITLRDGTVLRDAQPAH